MIIEIDVEADAAYIELADRPVAATREIEPGVMVDLDDLGVVVGIELLGLRRAVPVDRVLAECHVPAEQESGLRSLIAAIEMAGGSGLVTVSAVVRTAGNLVTQ